MSLKRFIILHQLTNKSHHVKTSRSQAFSNVISDNWLLRFTKRQILSSFTFSKPTAMYNGIVVLLTNVSLIFIEFGNIYSFHSYIDTLRNFYKCFNLLSKCLKILST